MGRACLYPFFPTLTIAPQGLVLGVSTVLVPMLRKGAGASTLDLEGREERLLTTLSILYQKALPADLLRRISRAAERWEEGEPALAHLELAYLGLSKIETMDDAWRLFCADSLLADGAEPHVLMQALGLDTRQLDLLKYNREQPRVPAGNGIESGRWTSSEGLTQLAASTKNIIKADPDASGPHTRFRVSPNGEIHHYTTFHYNEKSGSYVPTLRYRGSGGSQDGVEPPFVLEPKQTKGFGSPPDQSRPTLPHEIPGGGGSGNRGGTGGSGGSRSGGGGGGFLLDPFGHPLPPGLGGRLPTQD